VGYTLILLFTILRIETRVPPSVPDAQSGPHLGPIAIEMIAIPMTRAINMSKRSIDSDQVTKNDNQYSLTIQSSCNHHEYYLSLFRDNRAAITTNFLFKPFTVVENYVE
jgi:hypothetical protein